MYGNFKQVQHVTISITTSTITANTHCFGLSGNMTIQFKSLKFACIVQKQIWKNQVIT
jgi:hypothetical protein